MICFSGGLDSTVMFHTYHLSNKANTVLDKYLIGRLAHGEDQAKLGSFFSECKQRVREQFDELDLCTRPKTAVFACAFTICSYLLSGLLLVLTANPVAAAIFASTYTRLHTWMHMCSHGNVFQTSSMNSACVLVLRALGVFETGYSYFSRFDNAQFASAYAAINDQSLLDKDGVHWVGRCRPFGQHSCVHHVSTNIASIDIDMEVFSGFTRKLGRVVYYGMKPMMGFLFRPFSWSQHVQRELMLPLLNHWGPVAAYTGSKVFWKLLLDPGEYTGHIDGVGLSIADKVAIVCGLATLNVVPLVLFTYHGIGVACALYIVSGLALWLQDFPWTMIVMHYVEERNFKDIYRPHFDGDWGEDQCQKSTNFSPSWNHALVASPENSVYHLEHHLFPAISPHNLRHVAPCIQATCQQHGVPYQTMTVCRAKKAFSELTSNFPEFRFSDAPSAH